MNSSLKLQESCVDCIELMNGIATIYFSHAYIYRPKGEHPEDKASGWSRKAKLTMINALLLAPLPKLPNTILEGFLEVEAIKQTLIALPFKYRADARLCLFFKDGEQLEVEGNVTSIELRGTPIYLNSFA
jgi:hypothetical protein